MAFESWQTTFQSIGTKINRHHWTIEYAESIEPNRPEDNWREYICSAFARFDCYDCDNSWTSRRGQVVFHFQLSPTKRRGGRGRIKMRWFRQSCRECWWGDMVDPEFPDTSICDAFGKLRRKIRERIYGEFLGETNQGQFDWNSDRPHLTDHCEACRQGFCRWGE